MLWQGFSPDGFGEVAPGYAPPPHPRAAGGSKARRTATHTATTGNGHMAHCRSRRRGATTTKTASPPRASRRRRRVWSCSSAQSASGYKGVAIISCPTQRRVGRAPTKPMSCGEKEDAPRSSAVPEEAALAVARELAAEAAGSAEPLSVAPSAPARAPAAQSGPAPPPPPRARHQGGDTRAHRPVTLTPYYHPIAPNPNPYPLTP